MRRLRKTGVHRRSLFQDDFKQLLQSEAASRSQQSKDLSVSLAETEENADRLAEQIAKATLNSDGKTD